MLDIILRIATNLVGRLTGPLTLRLYLQPTMAVVAGVRAGLQDARANRPAYFWAVIANPSHRRDLLKQGWKDVTKVFVAAVLIDIVYQVIALGWVYPGEAVIVAFLLAVVPYVAIRGPVNRLARLWMARESKG